MFTTIVISLAIISGLIQCYFWLISFANLRKKQSSSGETFSQRVSVIICARNESSQLERNLPLILAQSHPNFEVIVVDHNSIDGTTILLQNLTLRWSNLRPVRFDDKNPGKHAALQYGITQSEGTILVFTDADCQPSSMDWIKSLVAPIEQGHDIVLGAAPFFRQAGVLNAFARWENFVTLQIFASQAMRQKPFMALGRNMAYRKELRSSKVPDHPRLIGGDDDLFINAVGRLHSTAVVLRPEAQMISEAKDAITTFFAQKRRHVSTSLRYSLFDRIYLFLFATSTWTHHILLLVMLWLGLWAPVLLLSLVRLTYLRYRIRQIPDVGSVYQFGWYLWLIDFCYLLYYPLITLFMIQRPPTKWK